MNTPAETANLAAPLLFDTNPDRYAHWKLSFDGEVATLAMDVNEDKGLKPGYKLKLNSYDLGVDIELNDALNRVRFEHPGVKAVVMTSGNLPWRDGKLAYVKGSGVQELTDKRAVTPDTLFRIASMTKAFTALSILSLRDQGRLSLDDLAEHLRRALALAAAGCSSTMGCR